MLMLFKRLTSMLTSSEIEPGSTLRVFAPPFLMSSHHTLTDQRHSLSIEMRSSDSRLEEEYRE